jgi:hypothetical protein
MRIETMGKRERGAVTLLGEGCTPAPEEDQRRSTEDGCWKRTEEQQIWRRSSCAPERRELFSLSQSVIPLTGCVALCLLSLFQSLSRPISLPSRSISLSRLAWFCFPLN